jgi:DNA-binding XRE family transcriptional regulator
MEQGEVAERAGIARATLIDFEKGQRLPRGQTVSAIRAALESAGVIFVDENGEGPGVRLRKDRPRNAGT